MEALLLTASEDEAIKSIDSFRLALHENAELQDRLPNARGWYARQSEHGGWLFAPTRWTGRPHMTAERYLFDPATGAEGRKIENRLRQWFTPLAPDTQQYAELHGALAAFLAEYGKQPNAAVRISLLIAQSANDDRDDLVDLLARVIRRLHPAQQARLRNALKT